MCLVGLTLRLLGFRGKGDQRRGAAIQVAEYVVALLARCDDASRLVILGRVLGAKLALWVGRNSPARGRGEYVFQVSEFPAYERRDTHTKSALAKEQDAKNNKLQDQNRMHELRQSWCILNDTRRMARKHYVDSRPANLFG